MKVHSTMPGKLILERATRMIEAYEVNHGKKPVCIEMTKQELESIRVYLQSLGMYRYTFNTEECTVLGVPVYVN